jgi:hypothetical protein
VKTPTKWLNMVAGLAVAVLAAVGAGHNGVPTPPATGCVQILRVVSSGQIS